MKRIIALALAALMLVSALVACGENAETTVTGEYVGPNRGGVVDNLPELDFEGATFTVCYQDQRNYEGTSYKEFFADTVTMDTLNDAIYNREQTVSKRLNVKFRYIQNTEEQQEVFIHNSILTGLDEYNVTTSAAHAHVTNVIYGDFYNVTNEERFPYLDLDQPWYSQYFLEKSAVSGAVYALTGDYNLSYIQGLYGTFFNKELCTQYNVPNLYDIVKSGKWTIDKLMEYASRVYVDVSGDGKSRDDVYGFGFNYNPDYDIYWAAFDLELITENDDGEYEFTVDMDMLDKVLTKLSGIFNNNKNVYNVNELYSQAEREDYSYTYYLQEKFAEDECLFMTKTLSQCDLAVLRNMKSEYGIIPLPKWDEAQKDYYSAVVENYSLLSVPKTVVDTKFTSAVIEALYAESYRYVTPAYYNKVLKGRYMSDLESTEMIDMISTNYKIDFGVIYSVPMKRVAHQLMRNFLLGENGKSISSYWRGNKKMFNTALTKLVAECEKNANK